MRPTPGGEDPPVDRAKVEAVAQLLFMALGLADEPGGQANTLPEPAQAQAQAGPGIGDKGHGTKWPGAKPGSQDTGKDPNGEQRPATNGPARTPAETKGGPRQQAVPPKPAYPPSPPQGAGAKASSLLKPAAPTTPGPAAPPKPATPPSPPAALRVTPARATNDGNTAQTREGAAMPGAPTAATSEGPSLGTTLGRMHLEPEQQRRPVEPAAVRDVSATGVEYQVDGDGVRVKSRLEIRNLKSFMRAMAGKRALLAGYDDNSKKIKAEAERLANDVLCLREAAKEIRAGARLVAVLDKLHESAKTTSAKAVDMHQSLTRGTEAIQALITNSDVRHGIIFRAVVDSDLTEPAEREFYRDENGS
ncbi:hypothetical protein ACFRPV_33340 [Kitasatospora sp. NPDC056808]